MLALCLVSAATGALAADHPWQITSADGESSINFGFLVQGQAEGIWMDSGAGNSQDIFLRRLRLIASGKVNSKLSFFIDTDSPNLGKGTAAGSKGEERIYIQDAILTYTFRPEFQLDGGMLLVAHSHNSVQGAASLLPVDYGPYTFLASDSTGSRVGRDYGLQLRGYLKNNHFEYRLGVYQGNQAPENSDHFRYAARVVWYPFEAETGYFYSGTSLGKKKILAIGAGLDQQKFYAARSADVFYDQPIAKGDGITFQFDYTYLDGGRTFPNLLREHLWLVEAGYYNHVLKLGPFMQLSGRRFTDPNTPDQSKYLGGLAYWASGHKLNLKLGVARIKGSPSAESWQVLMQGQVYIN